MSNLETEACKWCKKTMKKHGHLCNIHRGNNFKRVWTRAPDNHNERYNGHNVKVRD